MAKGKALNAFACGVVFALMSLCSAEGAPSMQGVFARWPLDAVSGLSDISGNAKDFTGGAAVVFESSGGPFGGGYAAFNGTADSKLVSPSIDLSPAQSVTVSFWMRATLVDNPSGATIFETPQTFNAVVCGYLFQIHNNGGISATLMGTGGGVNFSQAKFTADALDGQWHHVAVVFSHGAWPFNVQLFLDGASVLPADQSGYKVSIPGTAVFPNAAHYVSGRVPYNGDLADLCVYGRALGASEIHALANERVVRLAGAAEGAVAFSNLQNDDCYGWNVSQFTEQDGWLETYGLGNYGEIDCGDDAAYVHWDLAAPFNVANALFSIPFGETGITNVVGNVMVASGADAQLVDGHLSFAGTGAANGGLWSEDQLYVSGYGELTISFWVRNPPLSMGTAYLYEIGNAASFGKVQGYFANNVLRVCQQTGNSDYAIRTVTWPFVANDDVWHQVVVVCLKDVYAKSFRVYIDGVEYATQDFGGSQFQRDTTSITWLNEKFYLASHDCVNNYAADFDEVNIYPYGFDADDAREAYARERVSVAGSDPSLLADALTVVPAGNDEIFDEMPYAFYGTATALKAGKTYSFSFPARFRLDGRTAMVELRSWELVKYEEGAWTTWLSGSSRSFEFVHPGVPLKLNVRIAGAKTGSVYYLR